MTDGQPHAAGRPAPDDLSELEGLLGRDMLREQFDKLLGQLQAFLAQAPYLPPGDLAQEAHNLAGAAEVLGLRAIGGQLRRCQQAADEGDTARARAATEALHPMQQAFTAFATGY